MGSNANNSKGLAMLGLLGAGVAVVAVATSGRAQPATRPAAGTPTPAKPGTAPVTTPKPGTPPTPKPAPVPGTGAGIGGQVGAGAGIVPDGPSWANEPAGSGKTVSQRVQALSAFLLKVQPVYWTPRPNERAKFAAELVMAAELEGYPLDLLIGHAWAEGALRPYMQPTAGSGAYGPVQVTSITCADVGMSYPPANVLTAAQVGIRYMRKCRRYGAMTLNDALMMYGLGPGGFRDWKQAGCSGTPCSRPQSVWRHECGCSGQATRYRWKIEAMARKAGAAGLHTVPWARWAG